MARPQKEGLNYFSLDVDFFSDSKVKILKARYGSDGISLYVYLLCEVYKRGYYLRIDDDFEFIISDDLNMNLDKVKQVLNFLLERSLFDNILFQSDKVLTSAGIQKRFQLGIKTRALKNPLTVKRFWLLNEEETETFIKVITSFNKSKNNDDKSKNNDDKSENNNTKESKVNKSKLKDIKDKRFFDSEDMNDCFKQFIEYRKEKSKKPVPETTITVLVNKLNNNFTDDKERMQSIEQSIERGWTGLFEVRSNKGNTKDKFNNFDGRKYDIDDLERKLTGGN